MSGAWFGDNLDNIEAGIDGQSLNELFSLLSDRYVRDTLRYLSDHPTATLDRLATVLTGLEATRTNTIAGQADHRRIRIHLYHVVLPRLDEAGYLDFDTRAQTVTRTEIPHVVSSLLDVVE